MLHGSVSGWREWAEEHWEVVGVMFSTSGALIVSAVLVVGFNVVATRLESTTARTALSPGVQARPADGVDPGRSRESGKRPGEMVATSSRSAWPP